MPSFLFVCLYIFLEGDYMEPLRDLRESIDEITRKRKIKMLNRLTCILYGIGFGLVLANFIYKGITFDIWQILIIGSWIILGILQLISIHKEE